jgi:hypothetical protein
LQVDRVLVVDWSAANLPTSATNRANAIWLGCHDAEGGAEWHHRTRASASAQIDTLIDTATEQNQRLLIGFDFAFGYPAGLTPRLTGTDNTRALWHWLATHIEDAPDNRNNRFAVAQSINALFPEGPGPFWSHPADQHWPGLPPIRKGIDYAALGLSEHRAAETATPGAKSPWMLFNPGSVGSQSLLGLPLIHRLCQRPGTAVWPFDPPESLQSAPLILAEIYPSLLAGPVAIEANRHNLPRDQAQVRLLSRALWHLARTNTLAPLLESPAQAATEGWILGANDPALLARALQC